MNPYVFFVGCPRSGTTLLQRIGDSHSELAIIGELHWLPRWWNRRVGITSNGIVTGELVEALLAERRFAKLKLAGERVAELVSDGRPKHYARFVTELFDLHGQVQGKPHVGEKTPGYVRLLGTLHALWPHAKIVHLLRDGRDVALSVLEWDRAKRIVARFPTWSEEPVATAAVWWEWHVRLGREAAAFLGAERYYELRYESLVADPGSECRRLCDFLGLAYDPAMLRFHEGRTKSKPGLSAKKAWRPVTAGLRRWQEQMASGDVARFEAATGPLLDELGYERAIPRIPGEELASTARVRETFADHVRARRQPLPTAWERVAA